VQPRPPYVHHCHEQLESPHNRRVNSPAITYFKTTYGLICLPDDAVSQFVTPRPHWLLFRVRDSLDAVPRSQATNRPITRSSKTKPREQSCNNTIVSRQDTGRAVSPLARNQAASSGVVQIPRRCKVVHSATQTSALVQASLLSSTGTQQRKQTTRASNVACSSAIALEAVSIRPNDLNYPFRPFAARRPFTSEHQLISSALHVLRKRLSSHNAQLRLEHFLGFRFTIRRPTRFTHKS
jgi:hypothetical protein